MKWYEADTSGKTSKKQKEFKAKIAKEDSTILLFKNLATLPQFKGKSTVSSISPATNKKQDFDIGLKMLKGSASKKNKVKVGANVIPQ
mmetsp:Transcript_20137/g.30899  ORF Transcript_20137/g.30899 Transcript_20137/m.30899 type:complete len:88 (+) Transcript_20137:470-733(+)